MTNNRNNGPLLQPQPVQQTASHINNPHGVVGSAGVGKTTTTPARPQEENNHPFRVQGIALVVDQKGKEPKLVFRYPTTPPSSSTILDDEEEEDLFFRMDSRQMAKLFRPKSSLCGEPVTLSVGVTIFCCRAVLLNEDNKNNKTITSAEDSSENNSNDNKTKNNDHHHYHHHPIELFSIVVALVPRARRRRPSSMPNSNGGGWYEEERNIQGIWGSSAAGATAGTNKYATKASASFLAVVRVHVSLARLCPVLEQEERNCQYVTVQTRLALETRKSMMRKLPPTTTTGPSSIITANASSSTCNNNAESNTSVVVVNTLRHNATMSSTEHHHHHHHPLGVSNRLNLMDAPSTLSPSASPTAVAAAAAQNAEREQEILQAIMAAKSTSSSTILESSPQSITNGENNNHNNNSNSNSYHHQQQQQQDGNLVRELVQFFQALSRNEDEFAPTPLTLLGGEGVLYVNGHIAVAVEAVAPRTLTDRETVPVVRPYQTILFPHASTQDLLEALSSSSSSTSTSFSSSSTSSSSSSSSSLVPPQRVEQFLLKANPQKSISDIATDAGLTLQKTLDIATYLVEQGVGMASPVISRHSRLACMGMQQIHDAELPFSYVFGEDVNVFALVAFLTTPGWTLGEAMISLLSGKHSMEAQLLQTQMRHSILDKNNTTNNNNGRENGDETAVAPRTTRHGGGATAPQAAGLSASAFIQDEIESALVDMLYDMVAWLCGHRVIAHIHEYLVESAFASDTSVGGGAGQESSPAMDDGERMTESSLRSSSSNSNSNSNTRNNHHNNKKDDDTMLWQELRAADCLKGRSSLPAISWRLGVKISRLRSFVARRQRSIRIIRRPAAPGDDWIPAHVDPTTVLNEIRKSNQPQSAQQQRQEQQQQPAAS
ncbi:hypothetical protein ACA910_004950 [Epithemia clementina (nom. ined.)]